MKLTEVEAQRFNDDDGEGRMMIASIDNRGEPYRIGVSLSFLDPDFKTMPSVFFEHHEAQRLADFLNDALGREPRKVKSPKPTPIIMPRQDLVEDILRYLTEAFVEGRQRKIAYDYGWRTLDDIYDKITVDAQKDETLKAIDHMVRTGAIFKSYDNEDAFYRVETVA